jgi:hypothetical protein
MAAGFIASVAMAWIAAKLHGAFAAPVGGVSIGLGLLLGVSLSALAMVMKLRPRAALLIAAAALALVAVVAQHAWLYVEFRRQWHVARAKSPEIAMFRAEEPWSPSEYFSRELQAGRAAVWSVDAALIVGTAIGMFALMERKRSESGVAADAKPTVPDT